MPEVFAVPAVLNTDSQFMRGSDDGFGTDDRSRKLAYAKARAAGVNPTGKRFMPNMVPLGDEPFSPKGWVSDRHDVLQRCTEEGWDCDGAVKVRARSHDTAPQPYRIADDIVESHVEQEIGGNAVSPKERTELSHKVRERLMPTGGVPS